MSLWNELSEQDRFLVKTNMREFGGHFAGNLGYAWMFADADNERRIAEAFPDMVERFQPKNWRREHETSDSVR
jgi:hypothetical protein